MTEENFEETQVEETTSQETEELDLELETVEQDEAEGEAETVETLKAKLAKTEETNKKLYARLKKPVQKKPETQSNNNSGLTREEAILFAKGHTEEEVDLANKLAKVNGVSLVKAAEDDYFKSVVNKRLKQEKSDRASLGASNGNSKFVPKDVGTMPRDEHMKLYHEVMSKV